MFSGFESAIVDVGETTIFIRRAGAGKPVLLLHGFPETHLMWHRVAPALALWSEEGALESGYQGVGGPLGIWANWTTDLEGRPVMAGTSFQSRTRPRPQRSCGPSSDGSDSD